MYKLFEFIRSTYLFLLFLIIETIALGLYANSTYYTQAKILSQSNIAIGYGHTILSNIDNYFSLNSTNKTLLNRIIELEEELIRYESAESAKLLDSYMDNNAKTEYELMVAHVISNTINKNNNFIILNKGTTDGVTIDMVVLSSDGALVGYILECSNNYSVVLSIVSVSFKSSGRIAGSEDSSFITWQGGDKHHIVMDKLSKYADPKVGDEIVSTDSSKNLNLPKDILIGNVVSREMNETQTSYKVKVKLAADIANLSDVILVRNRDYDEITNLGKSAESIYDK